MTHNQSSASVARVYGERARNAPPYAYTRPRANIHTYIYIHTCVRIHICIYVYIYLYRYINYMIFFTLVVQREKRDGAEAR